MRCSAILLIICSALLGCSGNNSENSNVPTSNEHEATQPEPKECLKTNLIDINMAFAQNQIRAEKTYNSCVNFYGRVGQINANSSNSDIAISIEFTNSSIVAKFKPENRDVIAQLNLYDKVYVNCDNIVQSYGTVTANDCTVTDIQKNKKNPMAALADDLQEATVILNAKSSTSSPVNSIDENIQECYNSSYYNYTEESIGFLSNSKNKTQKFKLMQVLVACQAIEDNKDHTRKNSEDELLLSLNTPLVGKLPKNFKNRLFELYNDLYIAVNEINFSQSDIYPFIERLQTSKSNNKSVVNNNPTNTISTSAPVSEKGSALSNNQNNSASASVSYADLVIGVVRPFIIVPDDLEPNAKAIVTIKLNPNLTVKSVSIIKSSGNAAYDQNIQSAIMRVKVLPPLPDGANFADYKILTLNI